MAYVLGLVDDEESNVMGYSEVVKSLSGEDWYLVGRSGALEVTWLTTSVTCNLKLYQASSFAPSSLGNYAAWGAENMVLFSYRGSETRARSTKGSANAGGSLGPQQKWNLVRPLFVCNCLFMDQK